MTHVIKHLLVQPYTSASLTRLIGVYSAAQINRCLRQLKKAGLIGVFKDPKTKTIFYYNIGLKRVNHRK
jgi:DNA-binding HxlR family transcriptional regulator